MSFFYNLKFDKQKSEPRARTDKFHAIDIEGQKYKFT